MPRREHKDVTLACAPGSRGSDRLLRVASSRGDVSIEAPARDASLDAPRWGAIQLPASTMRQEQTARRGSTLQERPRPSPRLRLHQERTKTSKTRPRKKISHQNPIMLVIKSHYCAPEFLFLQKMSAYASSRRHRPFAGRSLARVHSRRRARKKQGQIQQRV